MAIDYPGIGLDKTPAQDLDILHRLDEFVAMGSPIFMPISNKMVTGGVTEAIPKRRLDDG